MLVYHRLIKNLRLDSVTLINNKKASLITHFQQSTVKLMMDVIKSERHSTFGINNRDGK